MGELLPHLDDLYVGSRKYEVEQTISVIILGFQTIPKYDSETKYDSADTQPCRT